MTEEDRKNRVVTPPEGAVDDIGRLLQMAGPRQTAGSEMVDRVHDEVHAEWRERVKTQRRLRRVRRGTFGLLAAAGLVAAVWFAVRLATPRLPIAEGQIAVLEKVDGSAYEMEAKRKTVARSRQLQSGEGIDGGTIIETSGGSRAALILSNGVSLRLDLGTRLRLINEALLILDRGRVYLDSGSGDALPGIEIRTPFGAVRDIGTQFDTSVSHSELRIRVREGRVDLSRDGDVYETKAGSQLTLAADGTLTRSLLPMWGSDWGWVQTAAPQFQLEGSTLADYLAWASRETGLDVEFADASIEADAPGIELHGTLRSLLPEQSWDAVLPTCGLDYQLQAGRVIITRIAA